MADENTTLLPQIHKVAKFTYADQNDYLNQEYGKDGKITGREKRLAKKYWLSDQRFKDQDAFNREQQTLFYRSVDAFIKAAQARQALNATKVVAPEVPGDDNASPPVASVEPVAPVAPVDPIAPVAPVAEHPEAPVPPLVPNWLNIATENGFNNLDEVKAFQKKVGLEETGQLNEESLEKLKWYNHMKGLNYNEGSLNNGHVVFFNDDATYYNNGRMMSSDGTMSDYDYKTLTQIQRQNVQQDSPIVTKENLMHHKNFRKHRRGTESVTINGTTYPVFVTKDLKNNKLGLINDWSYAFDPATGKVMQLHESTEGDVIGTGQGSYKWDAKFKEGAKWIDISSLVGATAASQPVSLQQFRTSNYFRPHKNDITSVTIDGVSYPILVTQNLLGNNYGLKNDHTYAFDASTGRVKALHEGWFGNITKGGIYGHGAKWEDEDPNAGWVDLRTLPGFQKQGGIIKKQYFKQGGTMNRIKYFQQGGPTQQQGAQDIQQQVVALVQAAMQGDEKANQTVTQIMEAAKAGDPQATQLAQLIQQVVQQMKGQATAAKWGSKLNYIRSLKYAKGGKACPECGKSAPLKVEEKACGGKAKKAKKHYFGGWL